MIDTLLPKRRETPFSHFLASPTAGGVILLVAAMAALFCANSGLHGWYEHLRVTTVALGTGAWTLSMPLEAWVNDGLMAVFFFVVGLEIKREVLEGELSTPRQAALSVFGALGGMVLPALLYALLTSGHTEVAGGWGVPMATDIAFALAFLSLLGRRVPIALKIFLTALAIVDDLGAILVIAVFYTDHLALTYLAGSAVCIVLSILYSRSQERSGWVYALLTVVCWYGMLKSGLHATMAGVLMALTVPTNETIDIKQLNHRLKTTLGEGTFAVTDKTIGKMGRACRLAQSPLNRLEHALHLPVEFVVMPVFAFMNAGVSLAGTTEGIADAPEFTGIMVGLILGKPIGVVLFAWLAVRLGLASLPRGVNWGAMVGVGCLAGVGFTMALFIANLAFGGGHHAGGSDSLYLDHAKLAILAASFFAGMLGLFITRMALAGDKPVVQATD